MPQTAQQICDRIHACGVRTKFALLKTAKQQEIESNRTLCGGGAEMAQNRKLVAGTKRSTDLAAAATPSTSPLRSFEGERSPDRNEEEN